VSDNYDFLQNPALVTPEVNLTFLNLQPISIGNINLIELTSPIFAAQRDVKIK
jgi:hypothetical protein